MEFRVRRRSFVYSILCITAGGLSLGYPTAAKVTRGADAIASTAAKTPGTKFRECRDCPEMIVIPPGSFTMGSPQYNNEKPQHDVAISRVFAVGVYHVTRDEYAAFVRGTGRPAADCYAWDGHQVAKDAAISWRNPGFQQTDRDPVVCVSWDDAKAYIEWLNVHVRSLQKFPGTPSGGPYRLLTEAEWEYVARAGTKTNYFWGDDANTVCRYANSLDVTGRSKIRGLTATKETVSCEDGYAFTSPVGAFPPNDFGLYDMAGDAWQWTEDCWHDDFTGAPTDGSSWMTGDCNLRVLKGASWGNDSPRLLRPAYRTKYPKGFSDNYAGFRVARIF
jgi:formylglycine-generating enzyme required for sulfatase activity